VAKVNTAGRVVTLMLAKVAMTATILVSALVQDFAVLCCPTLKQCSHNSLAIRGKNRWTESLCSHNQCSWSTPDLHTARPPNKIPQQHRNQSDTRTRHLQYLQKPTSWQSWLNSHSASISGEAPSSPGESPQTTCWSPCAKQKAVPG